MATAPVKTSGSSPHTRGAPEVRYTADGLAVDHPRIRGEHPCEAGVDLAYLGSSPHTRGAPSTRSDRPFRAGIIPAYAGSTSPSVSSSSIKADHPRIRGEHSTRRVGAHD